MRRNHGWVSTIQFYGSLVLCSHPLQYFWDLSFGVFHLLLSTQCSPSGCCTLVVVEERHPHIIVKRFGCTAIHNKALYKCIIHSFIHSVMTSLVDTRSRLGWEPCSQAAYPWIVWPSRRFLWEPPWSSGLQHCNSRTCGSFYYQFLGRGRLLLRKVHGYLRISMC